MLYNNLGLNTYDEAGATVGFTIFTTLGGSATQLLNMRGEVVHEWPLPSPPGNYGYLLPSGNLLVAVRTPEFDEKGLSGKGGRIIEMDWDGNILWEHIDHLQNHDFRRRENGNTVYAAWELMPDEAAARVQGGEPGSEHKDGIWGDVIREVDPDGNLVWEWSAANDLDIENYPICPIEHRREYAHINTVFPLPNGDVMLSSRNTNLIATIDRGTKKFSWEMCDRILGHQHDVQMLDNGNVLVFANGAHGVWGGVNYGSRILEIDQKTNEIVWQYAGTPPLTFHSPFISGCQRLPSGNTLICEGHWGRFFEVTPEGDIVWDFTSPTFNGSDSKYPDGNFVFRCLRYLPDSAEIAGRLGDAA